MVAEEFGKVANVGSEKACDIDEGRSDRLGDRGRHRGQGGRQETGTGVEI